MENADFDGFARFGLGKLAPLQMSRGDSAKG
jgi:hypothetical protein